MKKIQKYTNIFKKYDNIYILHTKLKYFINYVDFLPIAMSGFVLFISQILYNMGIFVIFE